ncbi:MAG: threonine/serine exporter family protein [Muribaculaceae bacterium]|nr:threonine/serine exporter family protein [Muribaculaceae bacterium]
MTTATTIGDTPAPAATTAAADNPPAPKELCLMLARYSAWLVACGATCIRTEMNVRRIAAAYGMEVQLAIMPRHVHVSVWEGNDSDAVTAIASVDKPAISFNINTRLSQLSWQIADKNITYAGARQRMQQIIADDRQPKALVLVLVALANASFCRLFGGDPAAMAIVAFATLAGYYVKQLMLGWHTDMRVVTLVCSFISSVLGATGLLFSIGTTPTIALATSVLYLVPGIPFINSFSDMLYRHYICAFSRFSDALVLTCCMSAGLCAGMTLMGVGMF